MTATLPLWRLRLRQAGERATVYVYAETVDEAFRIPRRFGAPYWCWRVVELERVNHLRPPHPVEDLRPMAADWFVLARRGGESWTMPGEWS